MLTVCVALNLVFAAVPWLPNLAAVMGAMFLAMFVSSGFVVLSVGYATGVYSDVSAQNSRGQRFLRGYQLSDANGQVQVTFTSATPGTVTGHASWTGSVSGSAPFTVETDGVAPNSGNAVSRRSLIYTGKN